MATAPDRRGPSLRVLAAVLLLGGCDAEPAPDSAPAAGEAAMRVEPEGPMDTTPAGTPAPPSPATIAEDQQQQITARLREWAIDLSRASVAAGEVTLSVANTGTREHALAVEGQGVGRRTARIPPGETRSLTVELAPGEYELYCPVREGGTDHSRRGMRTRLVVR